MYRKPVAGDEPLARYVFGKDYYRPSDRTVRHNAFMPAKTRDLSVYRVIEMGIEQIRDLGNEYVASSRDKPALGYARLIAGEVITQGLKIVGTEKPHPRHANIFDWPGNERDRAIAVYLAEVSSLVLFG
jgi:hypothetical protein